MSKSSQRQFKEKINQNRTSIADKKQYSSIITIPVRKNLIVKVDRKSLRVSEYEIKPLIEDLFVNPPDLKKNSIIQFSKLCDVCYDLCFQGVKNGDIREALFCVC